MSKDVKDRVSESKEEYLAEIAVAMGGRAAEEAIYGPDRVTSGAESDFRFATNVAEAMVSSFGFSSLGPVNMKAREKGSVSEQTKGQVDEKIAKILEERYTYALNLIKSKASEHRNLVEILMKKETLTQDEIYQTLGLSKR
jgi:ATP-dependent Zn protease